jgi:hypothetical protein
MLAPITMALYGPPKSGKTHTAGTFPRPVFISVASERGWMTLPEHPNWKNISVIPCPLMPGMELMSGDPSATPPEPLIVKDASQRQPIDDMKLILTTIENEYIKRNWRTVVLDTMTLHESQFVSQLSDYGRETMNGANGGKWMDLRELLFEMLRRLQNLPLHVVWVMHDEEIKQGEIITGVGPACVGANWRKVYGPSCRLVGYQKKTTETFRETPESPLQFKPPRFDVFFQDPGREITNTAPLQYLGGNLESKFNQGHDWCQRADWQAFGRKLEGVVRLD